MNHQREAEALRRHMLATYRALRIAIACLGLALPWVLWLRGLTVGEGLQASMSRYYRVPGARDLFVGILFAVGALLFVYRGYSRRENWALNLAAIFLAGVALVPEGTSRLHGVSAILFFACVAYVCLRRSGDTLVLISDEARRDRYRTIYLWLGIGMIVSPLAALLLALLLAATSSLIFFVEAAGVYAFAFYWLAKTSEIRETDAESRVMKGALYSHGEGRLFAPAALLPADSQLP